MAFAIALACGAPVSAQSVPSFPASTASTSFPFAADSLSAPAVPPRIAYQPDRQPPGVPEIPDFTLPEGTSIPVPQAKPRQYRFTRRYGTPIHVESTVLPDGTRRSIFIGGVIVNATGEKNQEIEFATDEAVIWAKGLKEPNLANGFETSPDQKTEVEVYMTGNVIVRTKSKEGIPQTLRAAQVYYDVNRERAIALSATLEFQPQKSPDPFRIRGAEVRRLDYQNWEALDASFDSSKLPSDPGLRMDTSRVTLSEREVQLRNLFGFPYRDLRTGERIMGDEKLVTAYGAIPKLAGVPLFYFPVVRTDATDPLGPFVGLSFGQNRIFGYQAYTTWDMFDLLAMKPPPGHKWRLNADYLSNRGPAAGTDYYYNVTPSDLGLAGASGQVRIYGIKDHGTDILGGNRGVEPVHPDFRGRADWRHQQEIVEGLYFQGQVAYLSDQNFLEQFYKQEFDLGPNHETFAYLTWNQRNFWAAGLTEVRLDRAWNAETQWLPRLDGAISGLSFLDDWFVYNSRANVGYALARPSDFNPYPVLSTDKRIDTGRLDFMQELSAPIGLGPVKLAPYGMLDLAGYTQDLSGDTIGRIWGGGGARGTLPFSRMYEDVSSELLNLRGLYHKAVLGANYF
ncbi:MAG TPA: hypothetical protein VLM40_10400, partial [Gemmata sp.]|nr:hypothetical protein [Gemmata sp.]